MPELFSLNALIREVCGEADDLNTDKIVMEVARRIPVEDRDDALVQALKPAVRVSISRMRQGTEVRATDAAPLQEVSTSARSRKVAGIRAVGEHWRRALQELYCVAPGESKRLADLTRDDLLFNIKNREEVARRASSKALQLRGLLDLVERHEVERVGQLPEQVLAAILTRAAA